MKILQIRLKNINSIKGEYTIDFGQEPLASAGLFAITGPTGSGKTTILDVITLALFCRIPRVSETISKRFIERTGLVLTRNMPDAMAEVTYSCNEGTYTSQWSISTNRNGNLRDYEMQIYDEGGTLQDIRKSEVPGKNELLIGLNFDQFVKAIILAQGDFAAFLKAKGDERGRLLEKVTGTWIYRELGKAAFQKNKDLGQELILLQQQEISLKEQLITDEAYRELLADLSAIENQLEDYQNRTEKLKEKEKVKREITGLQHIILKHEEQLTSAQQKQTSFQEEHGNRMERHARLQPHQKHLWEWKDLEDKIKEQSNRLSEITLGLSQCIGEDSSIKREVQQLTGSHDTVPTALEVFEKQVLELKGKLDRADTLQRSAAGSVSKEAAALGVALDRKDPLAAVRQLERVMEAHQKEISRSADSLSEDTLHVPEQSLQGLKNASEQLQTLMSETRLLQNQQAQWGAMQKERDELIEEVMQIPGQLEELRTSQYLAALELEGLQKEKTIRDLTASLEEHRKKLIEGEPCPLCGSKAHPFSDGINGGQDHLDQKLHEAAQHNETMKKQLNALESALIIRKKSLETANRKIKEQEMISKETERNTAQLRQSLPEKWRQQDPAASITSIKKEMTNLEEYLVAIEKEKRLKSLYDKVNEWSGHYRLATELSAALTVLFPGKDVLSITRKLRDRYTQNSSNWQNLTREQQSLSEKQNEAQYAFEHLENQLSKSLTEYASPTEALADLMDGSVYVALQSELAKLRETIGTLTAGLQVHRDNLATLQDRDSADSAEDIRLLLTETENLTKEAKDRRDVFKNKEHQQKKSLLALEDLQVKITAQKQQNEKWVLLNKYIGDAEGKKFSTFAQELTLLQLVQKANRRLILLSDRYLLGIPVEGEDDSLAVIDTHMGDMRRSVKSLSGGETFLVSLSLALALSDLAAQTVEINSLFIDEGFGSLDKLTLDQTMDTLEKLQYETGKTIGVISHVEAMQERITTQIKLEKGGQGYSQLVIA